MSRYRTVSVDVDLNLDDYDNEELVNELQHRGYSGYINGRNGTTKNEDSVEKLYRNYLTLSPEAFSKELKRFFRENLDVLEYWN